MKKKLSPFKNLIKLSNEIAKKIKTGTLLVIETTLPPGTTDKIILPIFKKQLKKRKIKFTDIYICYSYERVMPGNNYIDSIISNHRCYSGINQIFLLDNSVLNLSLNFMRNTIQYQLEKMLKNSRSILRIN